MEPQHQNLPRHTEQQLADSISPDAAALAQQKTFALNELVQAAQEIHHQSRQIKEIARVARERAEAGAHHDMSLTEASISATNTLNELAETLRKSMQLFRTK